MGHSRLFGDACVRSAYPPKAVAVADIPALRIGPQGDSNVLEVGRCYSLSTLIVLEVMRVDFDYIVVGAGSAGSIVASRLTEKAATKVLLLEAGPDDRNLSITIPLGYARNFRNPNLNWMYQSEPIVGLGGRRTYVPRGKVLGGSGAINGMIYLRGAAD
jgi:hypothetical protein